MAGHGGEIHPARRRSLSSLSRMLATGILTEGDREIHWGGEILLPASRELAHIAATDTLSECLRDRLVRGDGWLRSLGPIVLGEGDLPEPDVQVIRGLARATKTAFPTAPTTWWRRSLHPFRRMRASCSAALPRPAWPRPGSSTYTR